MALANSFWQTFVWLVVGFITREDNGLLRRGRTRQRPANRQLPPVFELIATKRCLPAYFCWAARPRSRSTRSASFR
jgi:hypothetical protein